MADLRKLTLLHSNDMHGDFLAEELDESLVGGASRLSGYVSKVRAEEENVLYAIAGDMFRGSIIDSEFQGISTIDIMNMIAPDVACLGNHELDYGVAHLLFLEKCVQFPIVSANMYIKTTGTRLFDSHAIIEVGGMKILFVGLLTEEIMTGAKSDLLLGTFVSVEDAAREAGRIINSYKTMDVDFTVLLTHIGYEEDMRLAELLEPEWGVDVIIGGHTHTVLEEPTKVNDVLIVQAGTGTDVIGRFDITIDCDTNSVHDYQWQLVPINEETCPKDEALEELINSYKAKTDSKYGRVLTCFERQLTHPRREQETELGNLFADAMYEMLGTDIALVGSGSIRKTELGPVVTLQDLLEIFPYAGKVHAVKMTGAQLRHAFRHIFRDEMIQGHTEFYQVSGNIRVHYDFPSKTILSLKVNGEEVADDAVFKVSVQDFHFNNFGDFFDVPEAEVLDFEKSKIVCTSDFDVLEEYLSSKSRLAAKVEGRLQIDGRPE